jgi:HPt (histidine-containing phosphotransfer) domain-containing protein
VSDFDERFAQLRARFAAQAQSEAAELERLAGCGGWPGVGRLAHGLAGRAGMFGHQGIGELALEVEEAIEGGSMPADRVARLAAQLRALDQER